MGKVTWTVLKRRRNGVLTLSTLSSLCLRGTANHLFEAFPVCEAEYHWLECVLSETDSSRMLATPPAALVDVRINDNAVTLELHTHELVRNPWAAHDVRCEAIILRRYNQVTNDQAGELSTANDKSQVRCSLRSVAVLHSSAC